MPMPDAIACSGRLHGACQKAQAMEGTRWGARRCARAIMASHRHFYASPERWQAGCFESLVTFGCRVYSLDRLASHRWTVDRWTRSGLQTSPLNIKHREDPDAGAASASGTEPGGRAPGLKPRANTAHGPNDRESHVIVTLHAADS